VAPSGIVYFTDTYNHRIRQLNPATGAVTTLAGSAQGFADGVGAAAHFRNPHGIAVAPSGVLYVSDLGNNRIRQLDPRTGAVTTLAGNDRGFADGVGAAAQFDNPHDIAVAPSGMVYVADKWNHRIRQLNPATGAVTTLAGSVRGFADGVGAAAQFNGPEGIAVAPSGIVYFTDTLNHRIRQLNPATGAVTTLAGFAQGSADGVGAAAQFRGPHGIAVAPSGIVYVADAYNHRIRQLNPATGAVTTLAGNDRGFLDGRGFADGYYAAAQFNVPVGIAIAPSGIVYVTDLMSNRIRIIRTRANPGLVHMARKAVVNSKSKLGVLPEHIVGGIFSYVGNTRGPGGGVRPRIEDPAEAARHKKAMNEMDAAAAAFAAGGAAAAKPVANMNALNRRSTRHRKARRKNTKRHRAVGRALGRASGR
jgi:streptogramin lyase